MQQKNILLQEDAKSTFSRQYLMSNNEIMAKQRSHSYSQPEYKLMIKADSVIE